MSKNLPIKKIEIYAPFRNPYFKNYFGYNKKKPSDFFWGINLLSNKFYKVSTSYSKKGKRYSFYAYFFYVFEKFFIFFTGLGAPFEVYFENKKKISKKSLIFCCNDALSIVFLFLKSIGLIRNKIIVVFQALSERRITMFKKSKINYLLVF